MSEDEILRVLNVHGVDYILAAETQHFEASGVKMVLMHIFVDDSEQNLTDLNFALTELNGQREADDFSLSPIPNHPNWLKDAPVHIIRCAEATVNVALKFPGITDSYETVKKRANLVVGATGELMYCMSLKDKLSFVRAFEQGQQSN